MHYTISDFQQLVFDQCCELDPAVMKLLQYLETQLDVSEGNGSSGNGCNSNNHHGNGGKSHARNTSGSGSGYSNARGLSGHAKSKNGGGNGAKQKKVEEEDWEAIRAFKSTKLVTKTGVDKRINDIRVMMNKLSPSNAETMEGGIMQQLQEYYSSEDKNEDADVKLASAMLQVCISNKFYDDLFAKFYKRLVETHIMFRASLDSLVAETKGMELIQYVDADIDYDAYCAYNKVIDARKAKCLFIMNMMKHGVIAVDVVLDVLQWIMELIMINIVLDGRAKEIEELAEIVFVFVNKCDGAFDQSEIWISKILPVVQQLGCATNKQYPSISNRIIFKFKDILDSLA